MRPVAADYKSSLLALKISESCAQLAVVRIGFWFSVFGFWPLGFWNGSPNLGQYRVYDRGPMIGKMVVVGIMKKGKPPAASAGPIKGPRAAGGQS